MGGGGTVVSKHLNTFEIFFSRPRVAERDALAAIVSQLLIVTVRFSSGFARLVIVFVRLQPNPVGFVIARVPRFLVRPCPLPGVIAENRLCSVDLPGRDARRSFSNGTARVRL